MLNKIIGFSLQNRILVLVASVLLLMKVCQNAHLHYFTYKAPTFTSWGFVIT